MEITIEQNFDQICELWVKNINEIGLWAPPYTSTSGPRLNIKTVLSTYGDFHVKDKTAVRTSYL